MTSKLTSEQAEKTIKALIRSGYIAPQIRQKMNTDYRLGFTETDRILTKLGHNPSSTSKDNYPQSQGCRPSFRVIRGFVVMTIGIVATVGSFMSASSNPMGGTYIIAWGAILVGGFELLVGLAE